MVTVNLSLACANGLVLILVLRALRSALTNISSSVGALFKARIIRGINSAPTGVSIIVGALLKREEVFCARFCVLRHIRKAQVFLYLDLVFQADMVNMQTSKTMITKVIILKILALAFSIFLLQGCTALVVGAVVGTAVTVAVEVAKVPFKVGDAVIDVVSDDDEEDDDE